MLMETIIAQDTAARTVFNIPAENIEKFEAQIAKLSSRALKLGMDPIKPVTFAYEMRKLSDGREHRVYQVLLTSEPVRIDDWTFVARLDHANETGTIVRCVPNTGVEIPNKFYHSRTNCDHCNVNRYRRDTFVVYNETTNEFKQVGSSCLNDFFGHDPKKIAKYAEFLSYAYEIGRGGEHFVGGDLRYISLEDYLQRVAASCRVNGWVSGTAAYNNPDLVATKTRALRAFSDSSEYYTPVDVTEADVIMAEKALEEARSITAPRNDYEHNISVISQAEMIEPRSAGLAASIVGVYFERQRRANSTAQNIGSFEGVINLMKNASSKLRFPKIRLKTDDGQIVVLNVAGSKSANPGMVNVTDGLPFGENTWFGRVSPDGKWTPSGRVPAQMQASVTTLLQALAADPAATAAKYGRMTGQCCFCSIPLKDERSVSVGYGKTCASNYNLPWG